MKTVITNNKSALPCLQHLEADTEFVSFDELNIQQSITKRFETIVNSDPQAVAVRSGVTELNYRELNQQANRLANMLLRYDIDCETPIVLLLDQGILNVIAVLGVLKSARFFLPLDPEQPAGRNKLILEESGADTVITETIWIGYAHLLAGDDRNVINIDQLVSHESAENPNIAIDPDSIAQIVYTSGSTGHPKGVIHTHRQVLHNVMRHTNAFRINRQDRQTLLYPTHAYAGTREIYNSLLNGACLCHYPIREKGVAELATWIDKEGITIYCSVTTVFRHFLDTLDEPIRFPHLRLIKLGGETTLRKDIYRLWTLIRSDCVIHCGLGISETGLVTHFFLNRDTEVPKNSVPLGYPARDMEVILLDDNGHRVAAGEVGEIAVRSRFISSGYWRRPELTRVAFLPDGLGPDKGGPVYLTGDKGWIAPDGCVEYRGRKNNQVKIRGNRVDLSEVEQVLASLDSVNEAAVLLCKDTKEQDHLVGYWTRNRVSIVTTSHLRKALLEALPRHAIPAVFVEMDRMPLTSTGKINKHALPAPEEACPELESGYVAPRTSNEEKVAHIWAEVLKVEKVGMQDNFFDLGGDSLSAVRLVSTLETRLDLRIPLIALFQGRTVEYLAHLLESHHITESQSATVAIQKQGTEPPFFACGSHPRYVDIARHMGPNQPFYRLDVYALQSERLKQRQKPYTRIEDIAACFIEDIRRVQPVGPYSLGGGCEGSMVAFEIANQLQSQGQDIDCLVLWLARAPGHSSAFVGRSAMARVVAQARNMLGRSSWGDILRTKNVAQLLKHEYIEYRIFRAVDNYNPTRTFQGKLVIIRFQTNVPKDVKDPTGGWAERATNGAAVCLVPGNHDTLLELHAHELGDVVQSSLRIARMEKQAHISQSRTAPREEQSATPATQNPFGV